MANPAKPGEPPESHSLLGPGVSIAEAEDPNRPKRAMGFRDLILFYVVTGISLRWIATAAAAGPSSIVIWIRRVAGLLHTAGAFGPRAFFALSQ